MSNYPLSTEFGVIVVYAIISDRHTKILKLALDTGATYTIVPFEAAFAIGCNPTDSKQKIEIVTASGIEYAPLITIPFVKAFGFEVKNLPVVCHNLPPRSQVDGLLGLNFLRHFDIGLYFLKKSLEISK